MSRVWCILEDAYIIIAGPSNAPTLLLLHNPEFGSTDFYSTNILERFLVTFRTHQTCGPEGGGEVTRTTGWGTAWLRWWWWGPRPLWWEHGRAAAAGGEGGEYKYKSLSRRLLDLQGSPPLIANCAVELDLNIYSLHNVVHLGRNNTNRSTEIRHSLVICH